MAESFVERLGGGGDRGNTEILNKVVVERDTSQIFGLPSYCLSLTGCTKEGVITSKPYSCDVVEIAPNCVFICDGAGEQPIEAIQKLRQELKVLAQSKISFTSENLLAQSTISFTSGNLLTSMSTIANNIKNSNIALGDYGHSDFGFSFVVCEERKKTDEKSGDVQKFLHVFTCGDAGMLEVTAEGRLDYYRNQRGESEMIGVTTPIVNEYTLVYKPGSVYLCGTDGFFDVVQGNPEGEELLISIIRTGSGNPQAIVSALKNRDNLERPEEIDSELAEYYKRIGMEQVLQETDGEYIRKRLNPPYSDDMTVFCIS